MNLPLDKVEHPVKKGEAVVLGMSGGVDSSAAAILLKHRGYRVIGATFLLYGRGCGRCGRQEDPERRAASVCGKLGIEHRVLDLRELFEQEVVSSLVREYGRGRTPNPCVTCNERVKFPSLASLADSMGIEKIATGHYALKAAGNRGRPMVAMASDGAKDQSYFLYRVRVMDLARSVFPVGGLVKEEARKIASTAGPAPSRSGESQDICFVPDGDLAGFLSGRITPSPGRVVDSVGNYLGSHEGIFNYTIGQRRGLGIAVGKPVYVGRIDPESGTIVLTGDEELYSEAAVCADLRFREREPAPPLRAKIRYRHGPAAVKAVRRRSGRCTVIFEEPQRAITPGQSLVLYRNRVLVGGGIIQSSVRKDTGRS